MSSLPAVSIITVNYGKFSITKRFVESVLLTKFEHFEVIVVDNNSPDDSGNKLTELYKNNSQVRIIASPRNDLLTGGYNLGAKYSRGTLLVFSNNDITFDKNWLTELMKCLSINNKYIIQPKVLLHHNPALIDSIGGRYTIAGFGYGIGKNKSSAVYKTNRDIDYAHGTILALHKSFFYHIGRFDTWFGGHYEDVDLSLRAKSAGGKAIYCAQSKVYHQPSVTYNDSPPLLAVYHTRKNRLRTIMKNFCGSEKFARLFLCLLATIILGVYDFIRGDVHKAGTTFNAIRTAFNQY